MKKNKIYLATKLFSFYDRYASTHMFSAVKKSKKYSDAEIYLPFRDSNMKVSTKGNVANNIFIADINSLKKTDIFICRIDGLSYDAGIGFEIGYCFANDCILYVFSTDFYRTRINNRKIIISNLVNKISNSFNYNYNDDKSLSYENNLENNIELFSSFVTSKIDKTDFKYKHKSISNKKYDVFIDFCGSKYEWNKILINKIIEELDSKNITYYISNRYKDEYNLDEELNALNNSFVYVNCLDENEPDFDSCILQGYAYNKGKYIIGYESNNIVYYVEGMQEMGVNLMIEQSCDVINNDLNSLIENIVEYKNGKEK